MTDISWEWEDEDDEIELELLDDDYCEECGQYVDEEDGTCGCLDKLWFEPDDDADYSYDADFKAMFRGTSLG